MRLGILGRADREGGITAQTLSVARNLDVSAALIIDLSPRKMRGPMDVTEWHELVPEVRVTESCPASDADLEWLLGRVDAIYAPEGPVPYRDQDFLELCAATETRFYLHVNPELFRQWYRSPATRLILPSRWHAERFTDATYLPMPTEPERFPWSQRAGRTFLHIGAPAMLDRNGSELVRAALPFVTRDTVIYTRGVHPHPLTEHVGRVELRHLGPARTNAEVYPPDADVLLIPRRYGGLCLPMLEAASLGMPILSLALEPQHSDGPPGTLVPTTGGHMAEMIGGDEAVHDADPRVLASTMDAVDPDAVAMCSANATREWALARSWQAQRPLWDETLV